MSVKNEILEEIQQEREVEQNKRDAIKLANQIYKTISSPEVRKESTPEQRHKVCIKKFKNFAEAFPLVLAKMSRDGYYNEKAFRRYLDRLHADPGKGMDGVMERQCDYAKFLYIEDSKARGRHWDPKTANKIWQQEYKHMKKWVKKTKDQEISAKSEFEDEQKIHVQERKQELLDFLQTARDEQQKEDPNAFGETQLDLENLDMDDISMSDSDELPESLVDTTDKQNKSTVVSQETIVAKTPEEQKAEENYKKQYQERMNLEKEIAQEQELIRQKTMHEEMVKDSNVGSWKSRSKKSQKKHRK